jgi:hypothetical protein
MVTLAYEVVCSSTYERLERMLDPMSKTSETLNLPPFAFKVKFMTHEGYRAQVDEKVYRLHTQK